MSDENDFRPGDMETTILRKILARLSSLGVSLGFTPENVANKTTDGTLAANSNTLYPSEQAVKTYVDAHVPAGLEAGYFGDGADGVQVFDGAATILGLVPAGGNYSLTRNIFLASGSSLSAGASISNRGFIIFCSGTFTINGQIDRVGGNGGKGAATGAGGAAGTAAAPSGGSLTISEVGGGNVGHIGAVGGAGGGASQGGSGSVSNSTGGAGGRSGDGGTATGGAGGAGVNGDSLPNPKPIRFLTNRFSTGGTTTLITGGAGGAGGGGGAGGSGGAGAGGGGGAGGAGIIACFIKTLIISATGILTVKGGNGGDGGDASNANAGGGGAGGGGGGGLIYLVFNTLTNSGTISIAGGTKGNAGNGNGTGNPGGGTPADGSPGLLIKYNSTTHAFE